jgi:hypothetical protein
MECKAGARIVRSLSGAGLLALGLLIPLVAPAVAQVAPDEDWKTLETPNFRVTFPAELESLARRVGARAEAARVDLTLALVPLNPGRVDIVLTDHLDISNGFAGLTPWRRIVLYARPPADVDGLQYFDEWIELLVVHELAHIVHLDEEGTLARISRALFGRPSGGWPFFPQRTIPNWTVEGLATWYESALTDAGRLRGTNHEMVIRSAALADGFEDLGQAGGDSPVWPGGNRYYIYGSRFFGDLLERQGADGMKAWVDAISGQWIPLRINSAGRDAFDEALTDAWNDWARRVASESRDQVAALEAVRALTEFEPVSSGGWEQFYPRILGDGVVYARSDRKSDPQLAHWRPGAGETKLQRTNCLATLDVGPGGGIIYSELQFDDP